MKRGVVRIQNILMIGVFACFGIVLAGSLISTKELSFVLVRNALIVTAVLLLVSATLAFIVGE